jgi:hypothetical protein
VAQAFILGEPAKLAKACRVAGLFSLLTLAVLCSGAACGGSSAPNQHRAAGGDSGASAAAAAAPGPAPSPICDTLWRLLGATGSRHLLFIRDTLVPNPGGSAVAWPRRGCWIQVVDSVAPGGTQTDELRKWFLAHGWRNAPYSADGPDGTMFGLFREPDLCLVAGHWDGGDDTDTTYVPRPGDELTVQCVPAAPGDSAQLITGGAGP